MALRGIQEYIARVVNNIARVEDEGNIVSIEGNIFLYPPEKKPSNIIIIHTWLCVSSYYLTIVGDCRLPFCHRTKAKACGTLTVSLYQCIIFPQITETKEYHILILVYCYERLS